MSQALPFQATCDQTCTDPVVTNVPGPAGAVGAAGAAGAAGGNAYTVLTAVFAIPAAAASATADVASSNWATVGQVVALQTAGTVGAGYYRVTNKPSSTQVTLQNLQDGAGAYADNKVVGNVAVGATLSPAGSEGPLGPTGPGVTQLTTKGDLLTFTTVPARQGIGTNTHVLHVDTTDVNDSIAWRAIDLAGTATALTGQLPVANGGTGAATAGAALTALGGATSGANVNITSLAGLTTPLSRAQGGTGQAALPTFRVTSNIAQAITAGILALMQHGTELFDVTNCHSIVSYLVTPLTTTAGYIFLHGSVGLASLPTGAAVYLGIYKNGATAGGVEFSYTHLGAAADVYLDVAGVFAANGTTDYFGLYVGSDANVSTTTYHNRNFFEGHWCG